MVPPYEVSVFINCPFDDDFNPFLDAILLAAVACGLDPRSPDELGPWHPKPRLERIQDLMKASKYSIHDLSRLRGEGDDNFARMNMPFELGMARGLWLSDPARDMIVLTDTTYDLPVALSDLGGLDVLPYGSDPSLMLRRLVGQFAFWPGATDIDPNRLLPLLPEVHAANGAVREEYEMRHWKKMLLAVDGIVKRRL
ncbi:MAG: hypothetical protein GC160_11060 [Acidobacteria bacterium]|nr:hypothetical protein [Acidobacteriota bacterium]